MTSRVIAGTYDTMAGSDDITFSGTRVTLYAITTHHTSITSRHMGVVPANDKDILLYQVARASC